MTTDTDTKTGNLRDSLRECFRANLRDLLARLDPDYSHDVSAATELSSCQDSAIDALQADLEGAAGIAPGAGSEPGALLGLATRPEVARGRGFPGRVLMSLALATRE